MLLILFYVSLAIFSCSYQVLANLVVSPVSLLWFCPNDLHFNMRHVAMCVKDAIYVKVWKFTQRSSIYDCLIKVWLSVTSIVHNMALYERSCVLSFDRQQLAHRAYLTAVDDHRVLTADYHQSLVKYAKKHHYLVSTFVRPGVYNSPCQVSIAIFNPWMSDECSFFGIVQRIVASDSN